MAEPDPPVIDKNSFYYDICKTGDLEIIQRVLANPPDDSDYVALGFVSVCRHGRLPIAKWFAANYEINNSQYCRAAFEACNKWELNWSGIYAEASQAGGFENLTVERIDKHVLSWSSEIKTVKWLLDTFPEIITEYNRDNTAPADDNNHLFRPLFQSACRGGQLKVAKLLYARIPAVDVRWGGDAAFRDACRNGQYETAVWLKSICPEIDVRGTDNYALKWADIQWNYVTVYYDPVNYFERDDRYRLVWWLLGFYSADEFWREPIHHQYCGSVLEKMDKILTPRRRQFMAEIAPELLGKRPEIV